MDIDILRDELNTDPLSRGYSGMTDEEATDDLNTVYRTRNRAIMTGSEIWASTDPTDYNGLSQSANNDEKGRWVAFCAIDEHDPFGVSAQFVIDMFGAGSTTVTTLQSVRVENVSRGTELGIGAVKVGNVQEARA